MKFNPLENFNFNFIKRLKKDKTLRWFLVIIFICILIIVLVLWVGAKNFQTTQTQPNSAKKKALKSKVKQLKNKLERLRGGQQNQTSSVEIKNIQYETSE